MLAGFLGLLGWPACFHAMVIGRGRRDHDLAVGRALGLRPRQVGRQRGLAGARRWPPSVRPSVIVLGVVAGRFVWQRVALGTGALVETVVPVWAMVAARPPPSSSR